MRWRPRLVGLLWRWHRRLGVVAALFAIILAITGISLNHSSELGLDKRLVDWSWLIRAYGDRSGDLPAYQLGEQWLSRSAGGRVYLDQREVAPCNGRLVGAVRHQGLLYAACAEELLLITANGELLERVSASIGLPVPLLAIGLAGNAVTVQAGEGWWQADLDTLDFSRPAPGGAVISQLVPGMLPQALRRQIPAPARWLHWERVILDLHSGRIVGQVGVLWMDAVAVLLASLASSGVAMWWLHRRRGRRHAKAARDSAALQD